MSFRNQYKPTVPRSPVNENRGTQALVPMNNQTDVATTPSEIEFCDYEVIEFTKEEINVLLNEKFNGKKFDSKGKQESMREYIKKLKVCKKWFQKGLEDIVEEKDNLDSLKSNVWKQDSQHKESTVHTAAEFDSLRLKSIALEETCSAQREEISVLQHQLAIVNEKLKMVDLSSSEIKTKYENQKCIVSNLMDRLREVESQYLEGERMRKKLHNTILKLKRNIVGIL